MHALGVLYLITGYWGVSACHTLARVMGIPLVTKSLVVIVIMLGCCKYSVRFRNGKAAGRKNCGCGAKKHGKRVRRGCVRARTGAQKRAKNGCTGLAAKRCNARRSCLHRGKKARKNGCTGLAAKVIQCGRIRARTGAQRRGKTAVRGLQQTG